MLAYFGEYWGGVIFAFCTGVTGVGLGFAVSYWTERPKVLLMFLGGCVAIAVAVLFPHGYTLFESNVLHQRDIDFFADSFSDEQLWAFIKARFWGALGGALGTPIAIAYFSPRWR